METEAIGITDKTIRGNKWIASVLSIMPGMGHLYLAEYNNTKHNFTMGISLIGTSIAYITILSLGGVAVMYSCIGYALIVLYAVGDAYSRGRKYRKWSGICVVS